MRWPARWVALACAVGAGAAVSAATLDGLEAPAGSHPAVVTLLESAQQSLRSGDPRGAAALLERALNIEPRNAAVWHYLGRARLAQGDHAQAEALAVKSHSLAADDRTLRERNARLTAIALEASGKSVAEMNKALQRFAARPPPVVEVAPASAYADVEHDGLAAAEPPVVDDAAVQRGRLVRRIPGWRRFEDAVTARTRRQRAWRDEPAPQRYVAPGNRAYRRYD